MHKHTLTHTYIYIQIHIYMYSYLEHLVPLPILDIIHLLDLDYNILSNLHHLGSPLGYCTLIFDLMRYLNIYNACIYIYSIHACMHIHTFIYTHIFHSMWTPKTSTRYAWEAEPGVPDE